MRNSLTIHKMLSLALSIIKYYDKGFLKFISNIQTQAQFFKLGFVLYTIVLLSVIIDCSSYRKTLYINYNK